MNTLVKTDITHSVQFLDGFLKAIVDTQLKHWASDLYPELELTDEDAFNLSLIRAQRVCTTLELPLHEHFKKVYRTSGSSIYCDYRLSRMAYLLISINGDVGSKKVAQIQIELVRRLIS